MIFIACWHAWYFAHFLTLVEKYFSTFVLLCFPIFFPVWGVLPLSNVRMFKSSFSSSTLFSKKPSLHLFSELAVSSDPPALSASLTAHLKSSLFCISTIHLLEALKQGQVWFILAPNYPPPHIPCCFVHGNC